MKEHSPCRHCQIKPGNRPRKLCHVCYFSLSIRERYPCSMKPAARRGIPNLCGNRPLPEPTEVLPGSAKVSVLEKRAELLQSLWHPKDAQ